MRILQRNVFALLAGCVTAFGLGGCLSSGSGSDSSDRDLSDPSGNNAPVISGTPAAAVSVGNAYSFTPSADDPDGDSLTFQIENRPQWASFDPATGRMSGSVTLGDVGMYSDIQISVNDGNLSDSLQTFNVEVVQMASGSVMLSWSAPSENTDGTLLTDLDGYRIYYGVAEGNYPNVVNVNGAGNTSVVIDNLVPDTYYFVGTAVNTDGLESDFSSVLERTVN